MNRTLKIKVCGMKNPENIQQLAGLEPDFMGLIFHPGSPRYVGSALMELQQTLKKLNTPADSKRVKTIMTGVFVDAELENMQEQVDGLGLKAIQLHGQESPQTCNKLREQGVMVIKAFGISPQFDWSILENYRDCVDYFLFDTRVANKTGGTGQQFDWDLLENYELDIPYFLSGGISETDLSSILDRQGKDSRFLGVDLNSKYELSAGLKDIRKLEKTFKQLRNE